MVLGHGAHDVLSSIRLPAFPSVGLGASVEVDQLLLSSTDAEVGNVAIPVLVVDRCSDVELVNLGALERRVLRFIVFVDVVVRVPRLNSLFSLGGGVACPC